MSSRREFLQKLTGSAIAIPLLSMDDKEKTNPVPASPYNGPVLKVAIMGLGSYGSRVADAMQASKMAKLTGVISGTPSKIKTWQEKYNIPEKNCYNYENFDS